MKNNDSASRSGRLEVDTYRTTEGSKEEQIGGGNLGKLRFDDSISNQNQDGICTYSKPRIPRIPSTTFLQNPEPQPKLNTCPFDTKKFNFAKTGFEAKQLAADTHTKIVNSNTHIQTPALTDSPKAQEKRRRSINEYDSSGGAKNHSSKSRSVENVFGAKKTIIDAQNDIEGSTTPTEAPPTVSENLKIQEKGSGSLGASYANSDGILNSAVYSSSKNIPCHDSRKSGPVKPVFGARNNFQIMEDTHIYIENSRTRSQISTSLEGSKILEKENKPPRKAEGNNGLRHVSNKSNHVRNVLGAKDEFEITADTYSYNHSSNAPIQHSTLLNIQDRSASIDHIHGRSTVGHDFKSSSEKMIAEDNEKINTSTCTIVNTSSTPRVQHLPPPEKPSVKSRENQLHVLDERSNISFLKKITTGVDITASQTDEALTKLKSQSKTIGHKEIYSNYIFNSSDSKKTISRSEFSSTPRIFLPKVDISTSRIYKSQLFSPRLGFRPQESRTLEEICGSNESSFNNVGHVCSELSATSQIQDSWSPSLGINGGGDVQYKYGNNGGEAGTPVFDLCTAIKNTNLEFLPTNEPHGKDRSRSPDPLDFLSKELEQYAEFSQHQSAAGISTGPSKTSVNPLYNKFDVATSRPLTMTIQQQLEIQPKLIKLLEDTFGKVSAEILIANSASNVARLIASVDPAWLFLTSVDQRPLRVCDFPMAAWNQLVHRTVVNVRELNDEHGIALNLTPAVKGLEESVLANDRFSSCKTAWSRSNKHFSPPEQGSYKDIRERRYRSNNFLWGAPSESEVCSISDTSSTVSSNLDVSAIPGVSTTTLSASAAPFIPRQPPVQPSAQSTKKSRSKKPIEPHGRGILIKNLPPDLTLAELGTHLGGGQVERIDFHDGESRTVVGIYFISRDDAACYRDAVNQNRGICWGGGIVPGRSIHIPRSFVDIIPSRKGGHEPIKPNVVMAMESEGATRCLEITGLPSWVNKEKLLEMISRQSKAIMPAVEYCAVGRDPMMKHLGLKVAVIRMASLGTALGARLCLRDRKGFNHIGFRFLPDPCQFVDLGLLIAKWDNADELDSQRRLLDSRAEMVRRRVHTQAGRRSGYRWY
ncbi:hypothetical protein DFP73DRAFT_617411 [Morchella snyderi]|nr:hypothetical protein DFP73DRAFT_617411 [Morchella snyderi]